MANHRGTPAEAHFRLRNGAGLRRHVFHSVDSLYTLGRLENSSILFPAGGKETSLCTPLPLSPWIPLAILPESHQRLRQRFKRFVTSAYSILSSKKNVALKICNLGTVLHTPTDTGVCIICRELNTGEDTRGRWPRSWRSSWAGY